MMQTRNPSSVLRIPTVFDGNRPFRVYELEGPEPQSVQPTEDRGGLVSVSFQAYDTLYRTHLVEGSCDSCWPVENSVPCRARNQKLLNMFGLLLLPKAQVRNLELD